MRALTRREALAGAGAAPLLAAAGAEASPREDRAILRGLLELEQRAVVAYAEAARSGKLDARTKRLTELFGNQEQQHARGLAEALRNRGGRAPARPAASDVRGLAAALDGGRDVLLRFLAELEAAAVARYLDAIRDLGDARLRSAAISILAAEGQHLVVLREALGARPVPDAFEDGRE